MAKVLVFLAEGFEEIEAISVVDILRRGGVSVLTVSLTNDLLVKGSRGICVMADAVFSCSSKFGDFDGLVLPGGGLGMENLKNDARVIDLIKKMDANGKTISAICASPMVFLEAGLLKDHRFTSYPAFPDLESQPGYCTGEVVADGNMITSRSPGTAQSFALALLAHFAGENVMENVKAGLCI